MYAIAYINFIFVLKSYLVILSKAFFLKVVYMEETEKHPHNCIWDAIGYT